MSLRCTYYRQYVGITNILTLIKRFFFTYVQIIVQHSIVHNMSRKKAFREFMTQAWGREPLYLPPRPPFLTTALNLNFKNLSPGLCALDITTFLPTKFTFHPLKTYILLSRPPSTPKIVRKMPQNIEKNKKDDIASAREIVITKPHLH